jgi:hypothetical protein
VRLIFATILLLSTHAFAEFNFKRFQGHFVPVSKQCQISGETISANGVYFQRSTLAGVFPHEEDKSFDDIVIYKWGYNRALIEIDPILIISDINNNSVNYQCGLFDSEDSWIKAEGKNNTLYIKQASKECGWFGAKVRESTETFTSHGDLLNYENLINYRGQMFKQSCLLKKTSN